MKLIRRKIENLEKAQAAASSRARPAGIAWSSDNVRVDPGRELEPGEHIAIDVHVLESGDWEGSGQPPRWRVVERITTEPGDTGVLYDVAGQAIGTARRVDASMIEVAEFATE